MRKVSSDSIGYDLKNNSTCQRALYKVLIVVVGGADRLVEKTSVLPVAGSLKRMRDGVALMAVESAQRDGLVADNVFRPIVRSAPNRCAGDRCSTWRA